MWPRQLSVHLSQLRAHPTSCQLAPTSSHSHRISGGEDRIEFFHVGWISVPEENFVALLWDSPSDADAAALALGVSLVTSIRSFDSGWIVVRAFRFISHCDRVQKHLFPHEELRTHRHGWHWISLWIWYWTVSCFSEKLDAWSSQWHLLRWSPGGISKELKSAKT